MSCGLTRFPTLLTHRWRLTTSPIVGSESNREMTRLVSIARTQEISSSEACERPSKRPKTSSNKAEAAKNDSTLVRRHPLGVRPSGNALTSRTNARDACGFFARLPDELLLQFLETLQVPHLLRLGCTCKALHAFTRSEELWRMLFIE